LKRNWHLVAYDVHDDQRLRRVAQLLEGYGSRVQLSVFRCRLTPKLRNELLWKLDTIMDEVDSLLVIPLCDHCTGDIIQRGTHREWPVQPPEFAVL
jgi:CRISPR-associated protein Cas2